MFLFAVLGSSPSTQYTDARVQFSGDKPVSTPRYTSTEPTRTEPATPWIMESSVPSSSSSQPSSFSSQPSFSPSQSSFSSSQPSFSSSQPSFYSSQPTPSAPPRHTSATPPSPPQYISATPPSAPRYLDLISSLHLHNSTFSG